MRDCGLERVMRDLRIFRIFEGTNDILRLFVALTGIQYAGGHLKELQKAFKNPTANLGLIFGEAAKRATKAVGLGPTPSFANLVHPSLVESANLTGKVCHFYFIHFFFINMNRSINLFFFFSCYGYRVLKYLDKLLRVFL